ncbi:YraN family protein [Asaia astilbis]
MSLTRQRRGSAAYAAGIDAEKRARAVLSQEGYDILASRCRTPFGEIDIVVALSGTLVFVEVKLRKTLDAAAYALQISQQKRLLQAAEFLIQTRQEWQRDDHRVDVFLYDVKGELDWRQDVLRLY